MNLPGYDYFDTLRSSANGDDVRTFLTESLVPASPQALAESWHWSTISLLIDGSIQHLNGHDIARKVRGALWPKLELNASTQARQGLPCPKRPICLLDLLWSEMGRLPRGREIPKPWVLRAFKRLDPEGQEQAVVQLVLFGLAASYCELTADALVNAFNEHIGDGHKPWRLIDHQIIRDEGVSPRQFSDRAYLRLLSPLKLSKDGGESNDMHNLLPGLIDRIEGLGRWHGAKLECDFKELRQIARDVELIDQETSRHKWVRKSSRAGSFIPMTDTRGIVELRGNLTPIAPFLSLLPIVHAGKDTRHGHGWISVES